MAMTRLLCDVSSHNFKFSVGQERRTREKAAKLGQLRREL